MQKLLDYLEGRSDSIGFEAVVDVPSRVHEAPSQDPGEDRAAKKARVEGPRSAAVSSAVQQAAPARPRERQLRNRNTMLVSRREGS